jgi:hypothetical protein
MNHKGERDYAVITSDVYKTGKSETPHHQDIGSYALRKTYDSALTR